MKAKSRVTGRKMTGARQDGQALAEYVFIVMLIALVCIATVTLLGTSLQGIISGFAESF